MTRRYWFQFGRRFALICAMLLVAGSLPAQHPTPSSRYLTGHYHDLHYSLPPPPADPDVLAVELDQVRAAQRADSSARQEAFEDAAAFDFEPLLSRFSVAAGATLSPTERPILAHMLRSATEDTRTYGTDIKEEFHRSRPYVADPSIQACSLSFLVPANERSYPSGHSTNGYLAALVLARAIPDRAGAIIARGIRYGNNRVICGAHFPSDVAAGQRFARFLFARMVAEPRFVADLRCALEETEADRQGRLPRHSNPAQPFYTPDCVRLDAAYYQEMISLHPAQ